MNGEHHDFSTKQSHISMTKRRLNNDSNIAEPYVSSKLIRMGKKDKLHVKGVNIFRPNRFSKFHKCFLKGIAIERNINRKDGLAEGFSTRYASKTGKGSLKLNFRYNHWNLRK